MTINKDLSKTLNTTNDNASGDLHDGMIPLLLVTLSEKYSAKSPNTQVHSQHLSAKLKVSLVRMNKLLAHLEAFGFIKRVTVAANNDISYNIKVAPSDLRLIATFGLISLKKLRQKNQQFLGVNSATSSAESMADSSSQSSVSDVAISNVDEPLDEDTFENFDIDDSFTARDAALKNMTDGLNELEDIPDSPELDDNFGVPDDDVNIENDDYIDDIDDSNDDSVIENDRVTQLKHHDEYYLNDGFESSSFLQWLDSTFYIHRHFQANEQNCQMSSFLKNEDAKLLYDVCLKRNLKITMTDLSKPQLLQFIDMQFQVYQSLVHTRKDF